MKNLTTILAASHSATKRTLISKKNVKLSLPYITLLLVALTIGFLGHWYMALTVGLSGSIAIYIFSI